MHKINHVTALATLEQAVKASEVPEFEPVSQMKDAITQIIGGDHLTYKYILATALLAKAVEPKSNPLVLQAKANVAGAYDARSLCHKVIVPHEARLLANGLGGSNEPYLNKPARFKVLSLSNAVRAGKDRRTLLLLHEALSNLKSEKEAFLALRDLVYIAKKQKAYKTAVLDDAVGNASGGRSQIIAFLSELVSKSVHGETSVLATAAVFWILGVSRGQEWDVQVHPVNESGSSSKEVSDIDVYSKDSGLIFTAEVKDKNFSEHDVEHALRKVAAAGHQTLYFICGPQGALVTGSQESLMAKASEMTLELLMLKLTSLIPDVICFAPRSLELKEVAEQISHYAGHARVKTQTLEHIATALEHF